MSVYSKYLVLILLLVPVFVFAYNSVIATPKNQATVLQISNPNQPQEFFGQLADFPHTFQFTVSEDMPFKASVFVVDTEIQKDDVSIILVKAERRGVTEIGRTKIKEQSWESSYDAMLAESWRSGGKLEYTLTPGVYTFEVSSPDNRDIYRLVFGTEKIHRGYFESIRVLFEVKSFLGSSIFSVVKSPLIYWPLLLLVLVAAYIWYKKRKPKTV